MTADRIADALDGLTARDLEALRGRIDRRLQVCAIDAADGAIPVKVAARLRGNEARFTLLICPACIERNRLPEGRAE